NKVIDASRFWLLTTVVLATDHGPLTTDFSKWSRCARSTRRRKIVKLRIRYLLTGALGLWLAHPVTADEPAPLSVKQSQILAPTQETSANQQIANAIADQLRQNGQLRHYNVHVVFQNGSAE